MPSSCAFLRPAKESAITAAIKLTPEYAEYLRDIQRGGGRISFKPNLSAIQNRVANYVVLYEHENKVNGSLLIALWGIDGYKEFETQYAAASPDEQQAIIDAMGSIDDESLDKLFAHCKIQKTPHEEKATQEFFDAMPDDEKADFLQRGNAFWMFTFSSFFNTFSLMVHGAKLTSLVPRAIDGDDKAFLQAVQIDRMLLLHHPFFRDRKQRAQNEGDTDFLGKLGYRESNPPLRGKIRFPALYMLFGILDAYQWLNDLRHAEILDICDAAGLDRYQNRIEDVNYLTKRLGEYRRWQSLPSLSMQ